MKEQPMYKSLKVSFTTWQALTRIAAATGEPRAHIIERLARDEEQRIERRRKPDDESASN
jgi:hypothetical protein